MSWTPLPLFRTRTFEVRDGDYTHYEIYCLDSRITIFLKKHYGLGYHLKYVSQEYDRTRYQLGMVLTKGGLNVNEDFDMEPIKEEAHRILKDHPKYCLLFSCCNYPTFQPYWLSRMVPTYDFADMDVLVRYCTVLVKYDTNRYLERIAKDRIDILNFLRDMWRKKMAVTRIGDYPQKWNVVRLTNNVYLTDLFKNPPELTDGRVVERLNLPVNPVTRFYILLYLIEQGKLTKVIGTSLQYDYYSREAGDVLKNGIKEAKRESRNIMGRVEKMTFRDKDEAERFYDIVDGRVGYYSNGQIIYQDILLGETVVECLLIDPGKWERLNQVYEDFIES